MNNEKRNFDIVQIDLSTCKLSVVFLVVTPGQNKLAHVALMYWGKFSVQSGWIFFILEQVRFSKKKRM